MYKRLTIHRDDEVKQANDTTDLKERAVAKIHMRNISLLIKKDIYIAAALLTPTLIVFDTPLFRAGKTFCVQFIDVR